MKVEYNGITLEHAFTEAWDEQVVYDSSGVNVLGNKITMTFQGNVYPAAMRYSGYNNMNPNVTTPCDDDLVRSVSINNDADTVLADKTDSYDTFSKRLKIILRRLSMPRHDLFVSRVDNGAQNNTYLFKAYSYYRYKNEELTTDEEKRCIDVNNGPKPISVKIVQKTDIFALISFTIEVTKIRCLGGETGELDSAGYKEDPNEAYIVSHRCWTEESIDNHFYCTRVTSGKIQVSNGQVGAHWARSVWRPPLEAGFRRESIRFSESEDGLSLSYVVTDKQVQNAAPYPATSFSGNVSYSVVNCAEMSLQASITLVGRINCPRQPLVVRGMQAVTAKLRSFATVAQGIIEKLNVSENLEDPPTVTVSMTARLFAANIGEPSTTNDEENQYSFFFPLIQKIGEGVDFKAFGNVGVAYQGDRYERLLSPVPEQTGYNPYIKVIPQELRNNGGYICGDLISWEEIKRSETAGFIHSLVTDACTLRSGISFNTDYIGGIVVKEPGSQSVLVGPKNAIASTPIPVSGEEDEESSDASFTPIWLDMSEGRELLSEHTSAPASPNNNDGNSNSNDENEEENNSAIVVEKDDNLNITFDRLETPLTIQAIAYPYTVYKSDVTYSVDYNRVILPQKSNYSSATEIQSEIIRLEQEQSQTYYQYRAAQLDALGKQQNNTRVVELSRPVPTARVVIEAERAGRLPDLPDPAHAITYGTNADDLAQFDPNAIHFTPIGVKTSICDPAPSPMGDIVVYKTIAIYDYAMSREIRTGDKILLLSNPRYEGYVNPNTRLAENDRDALIVKAEQMAQKSINQNIETAYAQGKTVAPFHGGQIDHKYNDNTEVCHTDNVDNWTV